MAPQVGQGALAVECRADDEATTGAGGRRSSIAPSRCAVDVERAFLAELGGGCDLPVGAHATLRPVARSVAPALLPGRRRVAPGRWAVVRARPGDHGWARGARLAGA